jgi:hypothetical protein
MSRELSVDVDVGDLVCIREYIGSNHEFETDDADVHALGLILAEYGRGSHPVYLGDVN